MDEGELKLTCVHTCAPEKNLQRNVQLSDVCSHVIDTRHYGKNNNTSINSSCCSQTSKLFRWDKVDVRHNREAITAPDEKQIDTVFQPVAKIPRGRENEVLLKMSSTSQQIGRSSFLMHSWGQTLHCTSDPPRRSSAAACSRSAAPSATFGCVCRINERTVESFILQN